MQDEKIRTNSWTKSDVATIQIIQERSTQIIFLKLGDGLFNLISSQQIMVSYYNKQETKYSVISCLVVGKE